jgi:N-methylhydantoinase A
VSWEPETGLKAEGLADTVALFHKVHSRLYGLPRPEEPVELVSIRCIVHAREDRTVEFPTLTVGSEREEDQMEGERLVKLPAFENQRVSVIPLASLKPGKVLSGPAIIEDSYTTIAVPAQFSAALDDTGGVRLSISGIEP